MEMEKKTVLSYNLQFFAEDPTDLTDPTEDSTGKDDGKGPTEKTFSQTEVNAIGAREKNQGKSSILKIFGCADEETAKKEAEEYKKWKAEQQTETQKKEEAEKALKEEQKRATAAENKLTALSAGISSDSLDDALAIALLKVAEDKSLDKVFEDMKKEQRYSGFFGTSSNSGGTGSPANHGRSGQGGTDNIGKRLAESRVKSAGAKSSFFSN